MLISSRNFSITPNIDGNEVSVDSVGVNEHYTCISLLYKRTSLGKHIRTGRSRMVLCTRLRNAQLCTTPSPPFPLTIAYIAITAARIACSANNKCTRCGVPVTALLSVTAVYVT